jgi:imidazolonepropionase-like amidohydrolase
MVQKGTYLVPTFSVIKKIVENPYGSMSEQAVQRAQELETARQEAFRKAYRAGVKIACGTDCTGERPLHPFGENAFELLYMVEAGMAPMDVIVAATGNAAQAIGLEDAGTLTVGQRADLIAVDENPLDKMDTLLKVVFVMQRGNIIRNGARERNSKKSVVHDR